MLKYFLSILLIFSLFQCTKKEFGNLKNIEKFTPIEFLKRYPNNYLNKMVKVKGKVVEESSRGLWINVQEKYFTISINFESENFSLPSIISNNIVAIGRFIQSDDGYMIAGRYIKIE